MSDVGEFYERQSEGCQKAGTSFGVAEVEAWDEVQKAVMDNG